MISAKEIDTLRSIARAGDDYQEIRKLLGRTDWKIDEDCTDGGFLRASIPGQADQFYRVIICYRDPGHPSPFSMLTFSSFPDSEEHLAEFNSVFRAVAEAIAQHLGNPSTSGERQLSFRAWPYAYRRWSLPEGEFTLIQDEFDIQEGMDVSLWIQPIGTPIEKTLNR